VRLRAPAALGLAGLRVRKRRTVTGTVLVQARLRHVLPRLNPGNAPERAFPGHSYISVKNEMPVP